jgi:hypothetical protein
MVERRQLTEQHCELWREGCRLLDWMSVGEYRAMNSDRFLEFLQINKQLTWHLIGPHSTSLFDAGLDHPLDPSCSRRLGAFIDWEVAQAWRRALIEATELTPRDLTG